MKNVAVVLMGIVIVVLAAMVARTQERLRHMGPPAEAEQIRGYLDLIDRYSQITRDPTKTGAAAVLYSKEVFKGAPTENAEAFFNDLLPQIQDPAIQRAVRMELIDLYLHNAKPDKQKAQDQVKRLLLGEPTTRTTTAGGQ